MKINLPSMASVCRTLSPKKPSKVAPVTPVALPKKQVPLKLTGQPDRSVQQLSQALQAITAGPPASIAAPVVKNTKREDHAVRKNMMNALTKLEAMIALSKQATVAASTTVSKQNPSQQASLSELKSELQALSKKSCKTIKKVHIKLKNNTMLPTERKNLSIAVDRLTEKRLVQATDLAKKIETLSKAI